MSLAQGLMALSIPPPPAECDVKTRMLNSGEDVGRGRSAVDLDLAKAVHQAAPFPMTTSHDP